MSEQEVVTFPGLRYDTCASAGLLTILGIFGQARQLSGALQKKCVNLLRRLVTNLSLGEELLILRQLVLTIQSGHVSLRPLIERLCADDRVSVKSRWVLFNIVSVP